MDIDQLLEDTVNLGEEDFSIEYVDIDEVLEEF